MADYISREAIKQVLCGITNGLSFEETKAFKTKGVKALYKMQGAKEILNAIDNDLSFIPATDVQPVKFARWIDLDNRILCSGCGAGYDDSDEVKRNTYIFCPNCGARVMQDGDAE